MVISRQSIAVDRFESRREKDENGIKDATLNKSFGLVVRKV